MAGEEEAVDEVFLDNEGGACLESLRVGVGTAAEEEEDAALEADLALVCIGGGVLLLLLLL